MGFALLSCSFNNEPGTPNLDLYVKGKVTAEDGTPIKGIMVIVSRDTCYTDTDGKYQTNTINRNPCDYRKAYFHDIDGNDNGGTFQSDSVLLKDIKRTELIKGDNKWYVGKYEYIIDIQLKQK